VACPCAFILATPTAMVVFLAARLGILIKNVGDIEAAARVNAFVSTRPNAHHRQVDREPLGTVRKCPPAELLRIAHPRRIQQSSNGQSAASLAEEAGCPSSSRRILRKRLDAASKRKSRIRRSSGRAQWLKDNGLTEDLMKSVDVNETEGFSLIFVARNGRCIGWIGLQDETRQRLAKPWLTSKPVSAVWRWSRVTASSWQRVAREIGWQWS
jgi:Cd2+/Zn2+-exporting ATPase